MSLGVLLAVLGGASALQLAHGMGVSNFTLETTSAAAAGRRLNDEDEIHLSFSAYNLDFDAYLHRTDGVFGKGAKVHILSADVDGKGEMLEEHDPPASMTFKAMSGGDAFTITLLEEDGSSLDGLIVKDGRTFHLTSSHGETPEILEDVDDNEGGKCGEPLAAPGRIGAGISGAGGVQRRLRSAGVHVHAIPRKLNLVRWKDCFDGDDNVHTFTIGIAVDNGLYKKLGDDEQKVATYISSVVAEANLIYEAQVGVRLVVGDLVLASTPGGSVSWNTCGSGINSLLERFRDWTRTGASTQGIWHLMTDCFPPPGTVGLAYVGTLCYRLGYNTGVSSYMSNFWKVVAHEIGHNFGARHSFEEGQGKTGGIMDYGDGRLDGRFQFNSKYRKAEICAEVQQNIKCAAFDKEITETTEEPTATTSGPSTASPTTEITASPTATVEPSRTNSPTAFDIEAHCRTKERKAWRSTKKMCKRDKRCIAKRASDKKWYCRAKPWKKTCKRRKVRGRWRTKCQFAPPQ